MSRDLVTIAQFRDLPEALLAKGKLESAGISAWLLDDNVVRMDWFWANAVGGVKLRVRVEDVESAQQLLAIGPVESLRDERTGERVMQPRCPRCGSLDIAFGKHDSGIKLLLLWAFGLPLPSLSSPYWKCAHCSSRWVEE